MTERPPRPVVGAIVAAAFVASVIGIAVLFVVYMVT